MAIKAQDAAPVPEVIAVEMAKDRELRREERTSLTAIAATAIDETSQRQTFLPQSMGEAMQFANLMSRSNFVPNHLRGKESDCLAIVMISARWGMDPFAVATKSYFVKDGAPAAFESQLINAVVNSSGVLSGRLRIEFEGEGEKLRCTVSGFLRADPDDIKVKTQSIARITTRNSPLWKNDPPQQLAYYTTRAWARLWVPEVLLGVYTPEELGVEPERARNVTPQMPKRGELPVQEPVYDIRGDDAPQTEEQARELDRGSFQQMERSDEVTGPAPYKALVDAFLARVNAAQVIGDIITAEADFKADRVNLPDDVLDDIDAALVAAKHRFKRGAAA